jgi:uncharacterized protein (TIGR03083 family)
VKYSEYCDELDIEVDRYVGALANADVMSPVPSCPEWTVRDLTEHLGKVHRWADQLVGARSTTRIPRAGMGDGDIDPNGDWLRSGGRALVATLRLANPDDPMWAWGADQHVRFWARRQLHETMVHRIDLELAMGVTSSVKSAVALDAIDEFFANLKSDSDIAVRARPQISEREWLEFRTTDASTRWGVALSVEGYEFVDTVTEPDAVMVAEPAELLAAVLRRRPLERCEVTIEGDASLVDHWLGETAFQ